MNHRFLKKAIIKKNSFKNFLISIFVRQKYLNTKELGFLP